MTPLTNHCREYLGVKAGGFCKEPASEIDHDVPLCAVHAVMRQKCRARMGGAI